MPSDSPSGTRSSSGRPRVYEDASERLRAFRERQGQSGYLRREVLATQETIDKIAELARRKGVPVIDVASSLLEYGLRQYEIQYPVMPTRAGSSRHRTGGRSVPDASTDAPNAEGSNPIADFFAKRKEISSGKP